LDGEKNGAMQKQQAGERKELTIEDFRLTNRGTKRISVALKSSSNQRTGREISGYSIRAVQVVPG
jgi:hypothetical protein